MIGTTRGSLRPARRLLIVALCGFLPLAILSGFAIRDAALTYHERDEARLRGTARGMAAALDAELGIYLAVADTLALSPMLDEGADLVRFLRHARPIADQLGGSIIVRGPPPGFAVLGDSRGDPGAAGIPDRAEPLPAPLDAALARVFAEARSVVTDLFTGPVSGRPFVAVVVPVLREGRVTRAIVFSVEPRVLLGLLLRQELPSGGFATIGDSTHRVIATTADPGGTRIGIDAPAWVAAAVGDRRAGIIDGGSHLGTDVHYAFDRPTVAPGWIVLAGNPVPVQQAMTWRVVGLSAGAAAAFLLGLAALAWAASRQVLATARQEAAALRSGRAEIERLLGGLPAFIFLRDVAPDGTSRIVYRAGDGQAVFGLAPAEIAASLDLTRLAAPETGPLGSLLLRALAEGSATTEWRIAQPDGSWRWLRTHCRRLSRRPDGGGEVVGYVLDIQAERTAAARATASSRLAALGEMAAGLAHELKQPLAIISLAAENAARAARTGRPEGVPVRLDRIAQQAGRAGELIEHLRRFARGAETGEATQPVPLAKAVEGALALVGGALREAGIAVELDLGAPPGPLVLAQLVPLEQVLANLLVNARDAFAGQPADAPRVVRIVAAAEEASPGRVRITLADTAGGIPPQVMAHLFEPFVTTKDAEHGTGLGLSICHGLVRGMGGTIAARNAGGGAVFAITLAAAPGLVMAPAEVAIA